MLKHATLLVVVSLISTFAIANDFPIAPDANLTPGSLCDQPSYQRYPEQINYCERDVSSETKAEVFEIYDQIGYRTQFMSRGAFKIDHYIPLCAGGSNQTTNLWPQHESIYRITDDLEALICDKMAEGSLRQADAVDLIIKAKNHLDLVPDIEAQLRAL
jgi:hypothetical protein